MSRIIVNFTEKARFFVVSLDSERFLATGVAVEANNYQPVGFKGNRLQSVWLFHISPILGANKITIGLQIVKIHPSILSLFRLDASSPTDCQ